jgi:hypothetical protein
MERPMQRTFVIVVSQLVCCSLLLACAGQGDPDVCTLAEEHVSQCSGSVLPAGPAASCSGDAAQLAQQVLNSSCDSLSGNAGKSDALSDPDSMAICIALAIPLFLTDVPEDGLCCFSYNCEGGQDLTCRKHRCRKQSGANGGCERNGHCDGDLRCVFGSCGAARQLNETCEEGDCEHGLICGPAGTCQPPGATNATCTENWDCSDRCIAGACAPRSDKGGACDQGDDMDCTFGLVCINSSCEDKPSSGGACDPASPFQCGHDETCWNGACEPLHEKDQPCKKMFDCQFGLFCQNDVCGEL